MESFFNVDINQILYTVFSQFSLFFTLIKNDITLPEEIESCWMTKKKLKSGWDNKTSTKSNQNMSYLQFFYIL